MWALPCQIKQMNILFEFLSKCGQLARLYMRYPLTIQEIMSTDKGIPDATFKGGMNWVYLELLGAQGIWKL